MVPETEIQQAPGMSLDDAIHRFEQISAQVRSLNEEKRAVADVIISHALAGPRTSKTLRVRSSAGVGLKVELKSKTEWDNDQLMTVRNLVGSETFDLLFKTSIEFTARIRELNLFLGTVTADERQETAKNIIREARIETESTPAVTVETPSKKD